MPLPFSSSTPRQFFLSYADRLHLRFFVGFSAKAGFLSAPPLGRASPFLAKLITSLLLCSNEISLFSFREMSFGGRHRLVRALSLFLFPSCPKMATTFLRSDSGNASPFCTASRSTIQR